MDGRDSGVSPGFYDSLVNEIVSDVTGVQRFPEMSRARFWRETKGLSDDLMMSLAARVGRSVGERDPGDPRLNGRAADKALGRWFRPWTRLAGRVEDALERAELDRGVPVDEGILAEVCSYFCSLPEYAPYLDGPFKGFVVNRCKDLSLDYLSLPEALRSPGLEDSFRRDFPYLSVSETENLLGSAYRMGRPAAMRLREPPGPANEFVGGDVGWSRYLPLKGVAVGGRPADGLGQIDYKDCTCVYVVIGDRERAVSFYDHKRECPLPLGVG